MEIDGRSKSLDEIITELKDRVSSLEENVSQSLPLLHTEFKVYRRYKEQIVALELLQLTEEKRRLLTCIIEWMTAAVCKLGLRGHIFFSFVKLHKRVNSATTMNELAEIGDELAEFKKQHPELEP